MAYSFIIQTTQQTQKPLTKLKNHCLLLSILMEWGWLMEHEGRVSAKSSAFSITGENGLFKFSLRKVLKNK